MRVDRATRHRKVATLGDIAAITKAQTLRSSSDASANEIHEASPGEFPEHGYLCVGPRKRRVDADDLRRYSAQWIQPVMCYKLTVLRRTDSGASNSALRGKQQISELQVRQLQRRAMSGVRSTSPIQGIPDDTEEAKTRCQ